MLPWQPIYGRNRRNQPTHLLHSLPWHSKTDWNIAFPISKGSVAIISVGLHRVWIWWDSVQLLRRLRGWKAYISWSISTLATFAWRRHCYTLRRSVLSFVGRSILSLSVYPSARITRKPRGRTSPNFLCMLPVAVSRTSSDGRRTVFIPWDQWAEIRYFGTDDRLCHHWPLLVYLLQCNYFSVWLSYSEGGAGVDVCYLRLPFLHVT